MIENIKKPSKNARRKLEVPMRAAMPCKKGTKSKKNSLRPPQETVRRGREPHSIPKRSMHVSWKHMNLRDNVWNLLCQEITKTTLQAKDFLRWPITIWFISSFRCRQQWKFRMQKQHSTRNSLAVGQKEEGYCSGSGKRQKESPLWYTDWNLSSQECGVRTNISAVQGSSRVSRRHCKKRFSFVCSIYWTRFSASQMTAAREMDLIARLPDGAGQAADAVSAYTQVKMEDAPSLLRRPKSECPYIYIYIWIRLPRHKCPKSSSNIEDPVVPLEPNLYGHPLAGLVWERHFEEVLLELGWEKLPHCECLFVHRKQSVFFSVYVDGIKMAGRKNWVHVEEIDETCWSWRINLISWPRIFGMHSTWMQTERNHYWPAPKNVWITNFWWSNWQITRMEKASRKTVAWSYDIEGHAQQCVERCCELAKKKTEQLYKVSESYPMYAHQCSSNACT